MIFDFVSLNKISSARRVLFVVAMIMLSISPLYAKDDANALCLNYKNGEKIYLMFSTYPSLNFKNDVCLINSADIYVEYPISEIDYVVPVSYTPAGLQNLQVEDETKIVVDFSNTEFIRVTGLDAKMTVYIYNINGVNVFSSISDESGLLNIPTSILECKTLYILSANHYSLKFYKK